MKIGIVDVDGHNYPNLPLMKLSAWHKSWGDHVEWYSPIISGYIDRVYLSKVFSFMPDYEAVIDSDEVIRGGSGYCIQFENGKEVYHGERDQRMSALTAFRACRRPVKPITRFWRTYCIISQTMERRR